jgi:hypothetical protein
MAPQEIPVCYLVLRLLSLLSPYLRLVCRILAMRNPQRRRVFLATSKGHGAAVAPLPSQPAGGRGQGVGHDTAEPGKNTYSVYATCATPSGRAEQTASVRQVGENRYSGSFYNSEYGISGVMHVVVRGTNQTVRLISDSASAVINLSR